MTNETLMAKEVAMKMKMVCKVLRWKVDPPSDGFNHVYMKAQVDGYPSSSVSFSYGRYPYEGRITVTAYTNHDSSIYRYGEKHLSISIGAIRSTVQIIKEIQRRFLPTYLEIARKSEDIQKKHDDYRQRLEACLGRLKGESLDESEKTNGKFNLHMDEIWGTVHYGGDDQVAIDVHNVPVENADRILAILRANTGSSKGESHLSDSERRSSHE